MYRNGLLPALEWGKLATLRDCTWTELVELGDKFRPAIAWLLCIWDVSGEGIMLTEQHMLMMASVTKHSAC